MIKNVFYTEGGVLSFEFCVAKLKTRNSKLIKGFSNNLPEWYLEKRYCA
jgi:hypothetical protein